MKYLELVGWYLRNQAQIAELEGRAKAVDHTILLAWIETNLAIAQRAFPQYKAMLADLNATLAKVIGQ
jgi:hypothetical protein